MSTPSKNDVELVMKGFEEFFAHMIRSQNFDLKEFVTFMEPKFKAAGYRDKEKKLEGGNILIVTEIGVGDFVLASGAIREVRRIYPDAHITLLAHSTSFNLAETCPYVDEIISDPQSLHPMDLFHFYKLNLQTASRLLERRFDICFSFAIHVPKTFLLMYMSGARIRLTAIEEETFEDFNRNKKLEILFMRLATNLFPRSDYGLNVADRFFAILENTLHLPITNRKLEIWCTPADISVARNLLRNISTPIYSLAMGGDGLQKHYPPEKYARLLEMILREEPTATFVILGGGQNDLKSAEIIKTVAPKIYEKKILDLTNKTNYRQTAAILKFCDMYIGNDTGTMHVAAALNLPVLSANCFSADMKILSTDTPNIFCPYGVPSVIVQPKKALPECKNSRVHLTYGCGSFHMPHCITQIKPETLFKGFHLLKERAAKKINEPLYIH